MMMFTTNRCFSKNKSRKETAVIKEVKLCGLEKDHTLAE